MAITHVDGRQSAKVFLYALSTCGWCRMTKQLLNDLGVAYDYIDMDRLDSDETASRREELMKWNPSASFPTIVVDEKDCIIGFKEDEIRKALEG
jgi:glutaredoxin-like protein NrdH